MQAVASLRYGVIFKKAFSVPAIFIAFVEDTVGAKIEIEIDNVETEKPFAPPIGNVDVKFDLFAQDLKNRIVVDIQHERFSDHSGAHWARFFPYHCVALLEQVANADNYRPHLTVYTIVVLTSGDHHKTDIAIIDFDPHDLQGKPLGEIGHKVIYLCPKYVTEQTPAPLRQWLLAIDDSLDETVDADDYTRAEIHQVFEIIQKDRVTPTERAAMFEEAHQEELKQSSFAQGLDAGFEKGREEGIEKGIEKGELLATSRLIEQILQRRLGPVPTAVGERLRSATLAELNVLLDAALTAATMEAFLERLPKPIT